MMFYILQDVLLDPFIVSTHLSDSIVAKRVYRNCLISLSHRVTHVDFVETEKGSNNTSEEMSNLKATYDVIKDKVAQGTSKS